MEKCANCVCGVFPVFGRNICYVSTCCTCAKLRGSSAGAPNSVSPASCKAKTVRQAKWISKPRHIPWCFWQSSDDLNWAQVPLADLSQFEVSPGKDHTFTIQQGCLRFSPHLGRQVLQPHDVSKSLEICTSIHTKCELTLAVLI